MESKDWFRRRYGDLDHKFFRLSVRAFNVLLKARLDTPEKVNAASDEKLLELRNLGVGTLAEIREVFDAEDEHIDAAWWNTVRLRRPQPSDRNRAIVERYKGGATRSSIASQYGISRQRVSQIIRRWGDRL